MNYREKFSSTEQLYLTASLRSVFGGAAFTRWGRKSCPDKSKLMYWGQMAGPDNYKINGGGSNFQCLPADPETAKELVGQISVYNHLRPVYLSATEKANVLSDSKHLPCVVCEATQRPSQVMIPAKTRCPSDWKLEYIGYLMSSASTIGSNSKTSYICMDSKPESLKAKSSRTDWYGSMLYHATASCDGRGALDVCPPYKEDQPLSCVVCTK